MGHDARLIRVWLYRALGMYRLSNMRYIVMFNMSIQRNLFRVLNTGLRWILQDLKKLLRFNITMLCFSPIYTHTKVLHFKKEKELFFFYCSLEDFAICDCLLYYRMSAFVTFFLFQFVHCPLLIICVIHSFSNHTKMCCIFRNVSSNSQRDNKPQLFKDAPPTTGSDWLMYGCAKAEERGVI